MIESLTKEQEALMSEYVKKYTELGLSTKPVSKERTEEIINQVYEAGGVENQR
jgi:hypothetical protein